MANLKSSKKDVKRNLKARAVNTAIKSSLKTYIKKAKKAAATGDTSVAVAAVKQLDKAAQKGVIHKNQAARRKSRMAKAVNKAQAK